MIKKMAVLKEFVSKIGRKKVKELLSIVEDDDPFVVEVKIKKSGIKYKKEIITLKDNQEVILEYIEA